MSTYSGKCDVYDDLIMIHKYTDEELANNVKIYQRSAEGEKQLKITCRKDLIPYYGHIVSSACYNNAERKSIIYITAESHVDREERDMLERKLKNILTVYNRCKRKKIEFDASSAAKEFAWVGFDDDIYLELANRVKANGKKANVDGLHMKMAEHYRKNLVQVMLNNHLNPLDYGDYQRFL